MNRIAAIDKFVRAIGANIIEGGRRANIRPPYWDKQDNITMPEFDQYLRADYYYYWHLFHELAHWTGHKRRLDRDGIGRPRFRGGKAMEELIAEFAAALLGERFGLWPHPGHLDYIDNWARGFKHDREKAIAEAKREAQRAVDYLRRVAANSEVEAA
jgi:antirestriction protein ArdC